MGWYCHQSVWWWVPGFATVQGGDLLPTACEGNTLNIWIVFKYHHNGIPCIDIHRNANFIVLMTFSSLAVPKVVKMTTFGTVNDENFVKWHFSFGVYANRARNKIFDNKRSKLVGRRFLYNSIPFCLTSQLCTVVSRSRGSRYQVIITRSHNVSGAQTNYRWEAMIVTITLTSYNDEWHNVVWWDSTKSTKWETPRVARMYAVCPRRGLYTCVQGGFKFSRVWTTFHIILLQGALSVITGVLFYTASDRGI